MRVPRGLGVATATLAVLAAGFVSAYGFRCRTHVNLRGDRARICYEWFRARTLTLITPTGQPFLFSRYKNLEFRDDHPDHVLIDLEGNGDIGMSMTYTPMADAVVMTQEFSLSRDGRIDLVLEFRGREFTRARKAVWDRCETSTSSTVTVAGKRFERRVCDDPGAWEVLTREEAQALIAGITFLPEARAWATFPVENFGR